MKVYSLSHSARTQKLQIAALYVGVDISVEEFHPRQQTEASLAEFKKKNPNGLIPTLETPEGCLYESNAILRHIVRSNDKAEIYGKNDFEKALIDQYLDWNNLTLESVYVPVLLVVLGYAPYEKESFENALETLKKALRILDDRLKQNKYLVGDTVSIADIAIVSYLAFFFRYLFDEKFRKPVPNLTKYYETVANEENFKKVFGRPVIAKVALPLAGAKN